MIPADPDRILEGACRFCLGNGLLVDTPVLRNDSCYYLASLDPVLRHAGMVVPFRHSTTPFELTEGEWRDTFALMIEAKALLGQHNPDGFTIGWNVGAVGGQKVGHVHMHIIARFADEPLAGHGIRHHIAQTINMRPATSTAPGA